MNRDEDFQDAVRVELARKVVRLKRRVEAQSEVVEAAQRMLNDFEREFGLFRDIEEFGMGEVQIDDLNASAIQLREALDVSSLSGALKRAAQEFKAARRLAKKHGADASAVGFRHAEMACWGSISMWGNRNYLPDDYDAAPDTEGREEHDRDAPQEVIDAWGDIHDAFVDDCGGEVPTKAIEAEQLLRARMRRLRRRPEEAGGEDYTFSDYRDPPEDVSEIEWARAWVASQPANRTHPQTGRTAQEIVMDRLRGAPEGAGVWEVDDALELVGDVEGHLEWLYREADVTAKLEAAAQALRACKAIREPLDHLRLRTEREERDDG